MPEKWVTVAPGIRCREHAERRHNGKPDRYYTIRYKLGGKECHERLGWASEGWNLTKARTELSRLKAARATGDGAATLRERRAEAQRKREAEETAPTLGSVWEEYATTLEGRGGFSATKSNADHIRHLFPMKIDDLRTRHVDALRFDLEQKGYAPQTIAHCLGLVRRIIRWGAKNGRCEMPLLHVLNFNMPSFDNTTTEFLTDDQMQNLMLALDKYEDQKLANAMRLVMCTGLRRGAVFALRWSDVSFERRQICLRAEKAKNGRISYIQMNESAASILLAVRPMTFGMEDFVFGQCRKDNRAIQKFTKYVSRFLPEGYRPWHSLRHTFASLMASSGVDLLTIQKMLTHRDSSATLRYAHLADEATRRAANIIDSYYRRTANGAIGQDAAPIATRAKVTAFRKDRLGFEDVDCTHP